MSQPQTITEQADELFEEIESLIRAKMQHEFDDSTSISPGLEARIAAQYEPYFDKIRAFKGRLAELHPPKNTTIPVWCDYFETNHIPDDRHKG